MRPILEVFIIKEFLPTNISLFNNIDLPKQYSHMNLLLQNQSLPQQFSSRLRKLNFVTAEQIQNPTFSSMLAFTSE